MRKILSFLIVGVAIIVSFFIISLTRVTGTSMLPNVTDGYQFLDRFSYLFHGPARGDIIVFHSPVAKADYVKRVIGLPGETVVTEGPEILIYNRDHPEGFKLNESYLGYLWIGDPTCRVYQLGSNDYLVFGDNRRVSFDSRSFGPIKGNAIIGQLIVR